MKVTRFADYFSKLTRLIGFVPAMFFSAGYLTAKIRPPKNGRLARVQVGPYVLFFPSLDYFAGLFAEIFLNETYYLPETDNPLTVIDCGANIGMSLLYIKLRAPRAQVVCFEPNPAARAVLEKNIKANGWSDVTVHPYAVGDRTGTVHFAVDRREATSSGGQVTEHATEGKESYAVEMRPLSAYLEKNVDLLKMDIEGGEFSALENAAHTGTLVKIAAIQLEYHYMPGSQTRPLSDMLTLLERAGFTTYAEPTAPPHAVVGRHAAHAYMVFAWR